jgi:hypothetical protein
MNLHDLKALGALVLTPPVAREVTWTPTDPKTGLRRIDPATGEPAEPQTFTVYIRQPSSGWLDRARTAAARNGAISYRSAVISHAIVVGDDLTDALAFSYEEADLLQDSLAEVLMDAYNAVNFPPPRPANGEDTREAFAKNSEPTLGSGTNSSEQASADAPSLNAESA